MRRYARTFTSRQDCYSIQTEEGRYITLKRRFQLDYVQAHLKGLLTLGAYALDEKSQARWLCLDADSPEQWAELLKMARDLAQDAVTAYLEPSRRGGHLWLFFSPLSGAAARRFGQNLTERYDLEGIELFPKQDALTTGPGSLVRLPLGRHRLTGQRYHFVTLDGDPIAPTVRKQVRLLSTPQLVPQDYVRAVNKDVQLPETVSSKPLFPEARAEVTGATLSERLKNAISVYDFVRRYVDLDANATGYCPFHDDTRKSFGVNQEENFWHCWAGCGGGSLIDFWMKWREKEGLDASFTATIKALAEMLLPR
ncbi:TOTE conflict system archaeo-eukaryotic primase domain-containing protein [Aggregatilinea lenta]|uniref:TOTE conflict system archaeo-eukaryotic primase domain-containing protein n=1 Tax=Aggregatilinea lenta TaxID=913108 RepID=UPI0013C37A00|nr:CHC2 zinc finger domain-containing protein [Aggregatilinea lenta]